MIILSFNPIQTGLFWSICDWGGGGSSCSGTFSDYYVTYHVVSKTGQNRSWREHMWSKDVEAKLFTVTVVY